jgi:hypothetical protein
MQNYTLEPDGKNGNNGKHEQNGGGWNETLGAEAMAFYRRTLETLNEAGVGYLVGGAYAYGHYTGVERHTKDFDIFVRPEDSERVLQRLAALGCQTERTHPHWLGKAYCSEDFIDVIYSSGNGIAKVDELWFEHASAGEIFGVPVLFVAPEEIIWSKSFIMDRERFDGADIAHLIRACGRTMDWQRLLGRYDEDWPVLLSHLVLYRYIYPDEQERVPDWVLDRCVERLQGQSGPGRNGGERLCRGTLLSRAQYLVDVHEWGYRDARLLRNGGSMSTEEIDHWTAAIETGL